MSGADVKAPDAMAVDRALRQSKSDGQIMDLDDAELKSFETLRAAAALKGYTLARTNPADGCVTYYAARWGLIRELRDLSAVVAFITQIGGGA
jgi:hypothetical protein